MIKGTDVRTIRKDGEVYINATDLILKINEHGEKVSTAFTIPEFKNAYIMAYIHIEELIDLMGG